MKNFLLRTLIVVSLISSLCAHAMSAQEIAAAKQARNKEVDVLTNDSAKVHHKLKNDDLPKKLGLTFNDNISTDWVIKKLGSAELISSGDASSHKHFVCYEGKDETVVAFSGGEMEGGNGVSDIEVYKNKETSLIEKCSKSSKVDRKFSTKLGLKLGLSRKQVRKIYGPSSKSNAHYDYFSYSQPSKASKDCIVSESAIVHYGVDGKVDWFSYGQGGSC